MASTSGLKRQTSSDSESGGEEKKTEVNISISRRNNHCKGEKHCKKASLLGKKQSTILQMFKKNTEHDEQVQRTEIRIAALIAEHNLPLRLSEHFCFHNNADEANEGMTAETLYNKMINALTSEKVCLDNLVGFGSDGCNAMFGSKNSVVSRLMSERVVLTALYNKVCEIYKTLLFSYLNSNYINRNPLADINPRLNSEFINLKNIYLGVDVLNNIDELDDAQKDDFYIRCREFLIVACSEIQKRFDFRNSLLSQISIFDPKCDNKPNSIFSIIKRLNRIVNLENIQKIDDQWRLYIQSELSQDIKDASNVDVFWCKISKLTDLAGNLKFVKLGNFVLDLMVMPHSNATCERVFSKINLMKTSVRNKLYSKTVDGLILASDYSKECHSFEIEKKTLSQKPKINRHPTKISMTITTTSDEPFQRISLDVVGPLPLTEDGNKFILTIQDDFTKFLYAVAIPYHTADIVAHEFLKFISLYGTPLAILTDQGSEFMSNTFVNCNKLLKTHKTKSTACHLETQGSLKRVHAFPQ
ncbi:hypothetical protein ILUMI_10717 [Ignelater luminosus]|uniref:Integrase catalytic domain-containing protein n=1 Tax=Ignelater luminosus TaxID=2038154 RepID=A0A8K0D2R7_IGNLU|nr:hypothetical protein ILUMI_10717 [Ignelater luminosus]